MLNIKSIIIKLEVLAVILLSICFCSGFLFFSKNFENKSEGKYKYYIDECVSVRNKEVKKAIDGTYNLKYKNVIFESEIKKDEMLKKKDKDSIAKYVVCFFDEYDVKNKKNIETLKEGSYYICDVTKEEFRRVLSEQIEDTNKKHQGIAEIFI